MTEAELDVAIDEYNRLVERYNRAIDPKRKWRAWLIGWLFPVPEWELDKTAKRLDELEKKLGDAAVSE